jgi:penicillin amidase
MKKARKWLVRIGVLLLVLVVIAAAVLVWFVRRPWSQVDGTLTVPGLQAEVQVLRDEWGVPHIYAENEHDLFFAQGYVHAQDRLWQMEYNRRTGYGTLSEVFGELSVNGDRFLRTLGMRRSAESELARLDDDALSILEAYADGVNAYIESHRSELPLEFTLLGHQPEPWQPLDTLVWGKVMSFNLSTDFGSELIRMRLIDDLGEEVAAQLMPPYADGEPIIVPEAATGYQGLDIATEEIFQTMAALSLAPNLDWGSNGWVISGEHTASGMPILANDTHLPLGVPSVWYENGLHGGRFDVVGFTFPGVPLVVLGHNQDIAWGITAMVGDIQDLYIERLNDPDKPTQYAFEGEWRDLEIIEETINVNNGEPETLTIRLTHHGPLFNDAINNPARVEPVSLAWSEYHEAGIVQAFIELNLATDWESFRAALEHWDSPTQNVLYADVEGNIGYQAVGKIPIRPEQHGGVFPVPGWTGEYDWQGFIPRDELPFEFNPDRGYIVTANNKVAPDDYPYHIAYIWGAPYRARRITELLDGRSNLTLDDMSQIQEDTYSLPAETLLPHLLAVEPANELEREMLEQLAEWDLRYEVDSVPASVFYGWYWFLVKNILVDEMGEGVMLGYFNQATFTNTHVPFTIDLMERPDDPWFDDVNTPEIETRDEIVHRAFADVLEWLQVNHGDSADNWQWGDIHQITLKHQPFGQSGIPPIEALFNVSNIPSRGDNYTVTSSIVGFIDPFTVTGGVAQRFLIDMGDINRAQAVLLPGQSAQLFHPQRTPMLDMWRNVEYHPVFFQQSDVENEATDVLILQPE